jgi:hypothetical protein
MLSKKRARQDFTGWEKVSFASDFGWRSGLPLRYLACCEKTGKAGLYKVGKK